MYKSGYDPQAFIAFFEKVQAQEKKKPGTLAKAFSTHPQRRTGSPSHRKRSQPSCRHARSTPSPRQNLMT